MKRKFEFELGDVVVEIGYYGRYRVVEVMSAGYVLKSMNQKTFGRPVAYSKSYMESRWVRVDDDE